MVEIKINKNKTSDMVEDDDSESDKEDPLIISKKSKKSDRPLLPPLSTERNGME